MKNNLKKTLCLFIAVAMLLAAAPLAVTAGADSFDASLCNFQAIGNGLIAVYAYIPGATEARFPTWTSYNGQDDLIWYQGTAGSWGIDGHPYNWAVVFPASDHNNESGVYVTHIYYNNNTGFLSTMEYSITTTPSILRQTYVQNGTSGYTAYAYVASNGVYDIARVQFPTWTDYNGQDDIIGNWTTNAASSGTAGSWTVDGQTYNYSYYVPFSSHNNETGRYNTHIYAYNTAGLAGAASLAMTPNFSTPSVNRVTTVQDGASGYWAYANVSTNGGLAIDRVQFPTWTDYNGQDDLASGWETNSSVSGTAGSWTVGGNSYNYRLYVPVSAHNNEYGKYLTDVYAYNKAELRGGLGGTVFNFSFSLGLDANGGSYSGQTSFSAGVGATQAVGTPTAPEGYHFSGWNLTGAGSFNSSSNTYTFGAGDGTLTASYTAHDYSIYVSQYSAPNCVTNRFDTYKCACGATTVKEIANSNTAHSYTGTIKDNGNGTHSKLCVNGCNQYGGATAHSYGTYVGVASPATCTENRKDTYKCECGATTAVEIANTALGHSFTGAAHNVESGKHNYACANGCGAYGIGTTKDATENCSGGTATCTASAVCSVCNTAYGSANATNHDFTKQDQSQKATDATCTEAATYYYTCSRCDAKGTTTYSYGEALGHSFTGAVQNVEDGKHNYRCARCDEYGVGTSKDETENCSGGTANCVDRAVCEICSTAYGDVDAANHKTTENREAVAPTCTVNGYTEGVYCTACDSWVSGHEIDPATGHDFSGAAHNVESGRHNYACANGCGAYGIGTAKDETEDCSGGTATCTEQAVCEICATAYGEVDSNNHDFTKQDQSQKASDATCTAAATYYYTCSRCDAKGSETYSFGDALGHSFTGAAQNVEDGRHNYKCERCDEYGIGTTKDETENCSGGTANCVDKAVCEICATAYGEVDANNHKSPDNRPAVAPKCTEEGFTEGVYCTACATWVSGHTSVPAAGHNWNGGVWTWAEDGSSASVTFTCATDGTHTETVTAAVTSEEKTPATCEDKGTTAYTAKAQFNDNEYTDTKDITDIPAKGHDFSGAARNVEEGMHNCKCARCDEYGVGTTKGATENCSGGTANCVDRAICEICSTAYGEVDANNHKSPENRGETSPTCLEEGRSSGVYCTACAKWVSGNDPVPATGHDWNEGEWSWAEDGSAASITFTCKNDGTHTQTVTAAISSEETVPAACTENGTTTYTAKAMFEDVEYTDTKDIADIPELGHDYIYHDEVAPTCGHTGSAAYATCSRCDFTNYSDIPALEHTPGTAVKENRVYGNGSAGSYQSVVYCIYCGTELSRTDEISSYDCPACRMEEIADQLGADTFPAKILSFMHKILHALFCLFDSVIGKGPYA